MSDLWLRLAKEKTHLFRILPIVNFGIIFITFINTVYLLFLEGKIETVIAVPIVGLLFLIAFFVDRSRLFRKELTYQWSQVEEWQEFLSQWREFIEKEKKK